MILFYSSISLGSWSSFSQFPSFVASYIRYLTLFGWSGFVALFRTRDFPVRFALFFPPFVSCAIHDVYEYLVVGDTIRFPSLKG